MNQIKVWQLILGLMLLGLAACATSPGDSVECPTCDNRTELLVGARCVPLGEVEPCGPDGHAHGAECHCFSGQSPTAIGDAHYCLQQGCGGAGGGDPATLACGEVDQEPERVTAVTAFDQYETVHLDPARLVRIALPAGQVSYVHGAAPAAGHLRIDLTAAGVLTAARRPDGSALELEGGGANASCPVKLPEVQEVHLEADGTYPHPVILQFAAGNLAEVGLILRHLEGEHHAE